MPLYEYQCESCQRRFEVIRKLSSPAIQFKGSGWYITDYSSKGKSGSESTGTSSDAKPAADSSASTPKTETTTSAAKPSSTSD